MQLSAFTTLARKLIILLALLILSANQLPAQLLSFTSGSKLFIQNNGQVRDQQGRLNDAVQFLYVDDRFRIQFRADGFSYELLSVDQPFTGLSEAYALQQNELQPAPVTMRSHRIDVQFAGMSAYCRLRAQRRDSASFHYYLAPVTENRYEHVPAYRQLVYEHVYPGIDLIFYAPDAATRTPRYEFSVRPGADPSLIGWSYAGATSLELLPEGSFRIATPLGEINETRPLCFTDFNEPLAGAAFAFQGKVRTFAIPEYDRSKPLLIDPNIIWGTYYGGAGGDEPSEIYVGKSGAVYIAGHTVSLQFIATSGAHQSTFAGGVYDYYLAKFNSVGKLSWGTYFGGNDKDYCFAATVDPSENIFIAGNSESQGLATAGAHKTTISGTSADNLIAKFASNGTLLWSTYYGGSGSENLRGIVCDAAGYLYVAGTTYSDTGIATPGAFQTVKHNYDDGVLAKFSPGGKLVWGSYIGDSGVDRFHVITLDHFGHVYVAGTTSSKNGIATPGAHQTVYGGNVSDAYLCKFDTSGKRIWCTYYGGAGEDRTRGLETDSTGSVFLAGFTNSDTGIATPGCLQPQWSDPGGGGTAEDNFLVRFDSSGLRLWGTYYGGIAMENLWGADIDEKNKFFYVVGSTNSPGKMVYGHAMQPVKNAAADCFIAKFNFDGFPDWGTYWGGPVGQQFEDVDVDESGFIYVIGRPTAGDMLVTPGTHQSVFQGGYSETIVYKFSPFAECYDVFEPNESLTQSKLAPAYPLGSAFIYGVNGCIPDSADKDWFLITPNAASPHIQIIISEMTVNYDLAIYDAYGYVFFQSDNEGLLPDTITLNNLPQMNFYLQIIHNDTVFDPINCYRLQVMYSDTLIPGGSVYTAIAPTHGAVSLYPNPVSDRLYLPSLHSYGAYSWAVYSLSGRLLQSGTVPLAPEGTVSIFVADLLPGAYLLRLFGREQNLSFRFVKQ